MLTSRKSLVLVGYLLASSLLAGWICGEVSGMSTKNSLFSQSSKFDNKLSESEAERTFQQFINSGPESTLIGELKLNSSELDNLLMRDKITSTIMKMQELERDDNGNSHQSSGTECFIEVNTVEKIPGRCRKVKNGLSVCQSNNFMAFNNGCI